MEQYVSPYVTVGLQSKGEFNFLGLPHMEPVMQYYSRASANLNFNNYQQQPIQNNYNAGSVVTVYGKQYVIPEGLKTMTNIVDRASIPKVDTWQPEPEDVIYKHIKNEIILPLAEFFGRGDDERAQQLNYFTMNSKRSYNSDKIREHICQYLNYFEKYYDRNKELLMVIYEMKGIIDYERNYSREAFMDDINRYIIRNPKINVPIHKFVADNYQMQLSSNGGRTPNLQFNNKHAKILYEISLMMNMYIPLATHYMYMHFIKSSADVADFMLELFDLVVAKYEDEDDIYIYNKLYETATSVVNKSKAPHKVLWDKNKIRGNNSTTHTKDSVNDIIIQIIPKYTYDANIINFIYFSNRKALQHKITDIKYELGLYKLSSSDRDADNNSEFDRYEASLQKRDEALALQNKVAAEQSVAAIERIYGPFYKDEITHYRKALTKGGSNVINKITSELLGYTFFKDLGDPEVWRHIPNTEHYIMLMISAKKMLLNAEFIILPYIISSRVVKMSTRKVINKSNSNEIKSSPLWPQFQMKYNNERIEQQFMDLLGTIKTSSFEMINWDEQNNCPAEHDGVLVPMIDDLIDEEMLRFAILI